MTYTKSVEQPVQGNAFVYSMCWALLFLALIFGTAWYRIDVKERMNKLEADLMKLENTEQNLRSETERLETRIAEASSSEVLFNYVQQFELRVRPAQEGETYLVRNGHGLTPSSEPMASSTQELVLN